MQDHGKNNDLIDLMMSKNLEDKLSTSKYSHGSNRRFQYHNNQVDEKYKIRHKLLKADLAPKDIKEEFSFTDHDDTKYIENFISIYSKWSGSDVIGYHDDSIKISLNRNIEHNGVPPFLNQFKYFWEWCVKGKLKFPTSYKS